MGKLKVMLVTVIAVTAIASGVIFVYDLDVFGFFNSQTETTAATLAERSVDTDVITTNLASSGHFAVVQFNILLNNVKTKKELEKRTPEVRAAIIATIAGFTKEQLIGREGIATLEAELSAKLDQIVQSEQINRVLVTEFKVQ